MELRPFYGRDQRTRTKIIITNILYDSESKYVSFGCTCCLTKAQRVQSQKLYWNNKCWMKWPKCPYIMLFPNLGHWVGPLTPEKPSSPDVVNWEKAIANTQLLFPTPCALFSEPILSLKEKPIYHPIFIFFLWTPEKSIYHPTWNPCIILLEEGKKKRDYFKANLQN